MPILPFFPRKKLSFTPKQISGLALWLKADAGVLEAASDPAEDGDNVWRWEDQSGNGNHANQTTVADQPRYVENVLNDLPAIEFIEGGTEWLEIAHSAEINHASTGDVGRAKTWFFVVDGFNGQGSSDTLWGGSDVTEVAIGWYGSFQTYCQTAAQQSFGRLDAADIDKGWRIIRVEYDGSSTSAGWSQYQYGTQVDEGGFEVGSGDTAYDTTGFFIGRRPAPLSDYFDGYLGEVLVYDKVLSSSESARVQEYLEERWGLPVANANAYISSTAVSASLSTTPVAYGGTWASTFLSEFTLNTSTGVLTYTGTVTKTFEVTVSVSGQISGGTHDIISSIGKNGVTSTITGSEVTRELSAGGGGSIGAWAHVIQVSLSTNDTLQMGVARVSGLGQTFTAETCSVSITQA